MSFSYMIAEEMKKHPFLIVIIFFVAGSITTYGVKTYAEITDVNKIETDLKNSMNSFQIAVNTKLLSFELKLENSQNIAYQIQLQSQIDDIDTEIFNLTEVVLANSNQPTRIRAQISKYTIRKNKILRELTNLELSMRK